MELGHAFCIVSQSGGSGGFGAGLEHVTVVGLNEDETNGQLMIQSSGDSRRHRRGSSCSGERKRREPPSSAVPKRSTVWGANFSDDL